MIVLDTTTKSLTVSMAAVATTTNPDFVVAWSDDNGSSFVEGSSDGALNGTTQVTLVSSPASSTRRLIKSVYIENKDTVANTITITLNNNGTLRNISKVTLNVGDTWSTDGTFDTYGNLKQTLGTINLSSGVIGVLPVANGGTGVTTATGTGSVMLNTNPTITNYVETLYLPSAGTSFTISLANGTIQEISLNGNGTITLPSSVAGKSYTIIVTYSGSYTLTWAGGGTLKWSGGATPTATSASGKYDIFNFYCDGTNTYGSVYGLNF